jgi:hypothetical protein
MIMSLVLQPAVAHAASYIIVQLRSRNPLMCSKISGLNQWLHLTQLSSANGEYSSSFKSSKMGFWVYLTSLFERGPPMWISLQASLHSSFVAAKISMGMLEKDIFKQGGEILYL